MKADLLDIGMFRDYLANKGFKSSYVQRCCQIIEMFLSSNPDIDDLNSYNSFLVQYSIKKRNYLYFYALKSFIKFKITDQNEQDKIIKNLVNVKLQEPIKHSVYLPDEKRNQVINNMDNDRHKLIARLMNETGARVGDILKIPRGNINFENYNGILAMKLDIIGKGGKRVPKWIFQKELQDEVLTFINDKYGDEKYYFVDRNNILNKNIDNDEVVIRTNYHWFWQDLKKALEKSNVNQKDFATHDFRRSTARDVFINPNIADKDPTVLQRFLGHARIETTMRYLKQSGLSNIETSKKLAEWKIKR